MGAQIPRYPPFVKGLPLVTAEHLLQTQKELVDRIAYSTGLEREEFDQLVLPVLTRYAKFVHLLPASEMHHHRGAGGLLRHGLEAAFLASQAAEGKVFAFGKTPLERRLEEPRWRLAACLGGLLHDVGKPVSDLEVLDTDGQSWNPYLNSLYEWGEGKRLKSYFIRWRSGRSRQHEQISLLVLDQILTPEIKAWLAEPGTSVMKAMLDAIAGSGDDTILTKIVIAADTASVDRDKRSHNAITGDASLGVPVERYIIDAMRWLLSEDWTVNERGSRVWVTREGVFVVWTKAAEEIASRLRKERIPGVPFSPDTLADLLLERELALPRELPDGDFYRYWKIAPEVLNEERSEPIWLRCLKLSSADLLFSADVPTLARVEIDGELERGQDETEEGATSPEVAAEKTAEASQSESGQAPDEAEKVESNKKMRESLVLPEELTEDGEDLPEIDDNVKLPPPPVPAAKAPRFEATGRGRKETARAPVGREPKPPSLDEKEQARAWLKEKGEAGSLILRMLKDIDGGVSSAEQLFGRQGKVLYIRYPNAVRRYAKPAEVLTAIEAAGWLIPDPTNPNLKAQKMAGDARGLVLKAEPAEKIVAATSVPEDTEASAGGSKAKRQQSVPSQLREGDHYRVLAESFMALIRAEEAVVPGLKREGGRFVCPQVVINWTARRLGSSAGDVREALKRHEGINLVGTKSLDFAVEEISAD